MTKKKKTNNNYMKAKIGLMQTKEKENKKKSNKSKRNYSFTQASPPSALL